MTPWVPLRVPVSVIAYRIFRAVSKGDESKTGLSERRTGLIVECALRLLRREQASIRTSPVVLSWKMKAVKVPTQECSRNPEPSRILAVSDGRQQPLFDSPNGELSAPSSSLLAETHMGVKGHTSTRTIQKQVLTLFLEPGKLDHARSGTPMTRIAVPANAVVFSLRDEVETVCWVEPARMFSVQMEDRVLDEMAQTLELGDHVALSPTPGVNDTRLSALLRALHAEQQNGYEAGRLFIDSVEQALATLLVTRFGTLSRDDGAQRAKLSPVRANRVADFVRAHLDSPLRLNELATCAGYSPSHFSLLFQNTFGTTVHRYVLRARIEAAMTMLVSRNDSILEIALQCGFQTQQHFARVFRGMSGMSPGEYRRRP